MFKKNLLSILMLMMGIFILSACSDDANSEGSANNEEDVYTIRFAMAVPETHASSIAMNEIKDSITEESDGRLVVELYDNSELYDSDREAVEATQLGNVEATAVATPTMATFEESFSVFDMPFLFDDRDHAYAAMDGELGDTLNETVEDVSLKSLGYGENGFRHIANNKHPIEKPEDLDGMKFRVIENKVYEDMFNELGTNASPLAFGELYTSLQQGVYDGMDNPISLISTMKFNEVQDYLTLSGHTFAPIISVINKEYFESMPEDLQELLEEKMTEFNDRQREITQEQDEEYLEELADDMEITELSDEEKEAFADELEPIYDKYEDSIGEDLLEMVEEAKE